MKTALLVSAALTAMTAIGFASTESSEMATTTIRTEKFYGVILNSNANVVLSQTGENSVIVEGDRREVEGITAEVENGALVINGEKGQGVTVYVTVDDISLVEINGSGKLFVRGSLNSDILLLKVNGNGSMKLDVRTLSLGMIVKGSGKIIASGSTGENFKRIYGNGNIYSDHLDSFRTSEERLAMNDETAKTKRGTLKIQ